MASAKDLFNDDEKESVVAAIRAVELSTSGEIRVHIDDRCDGDAFQRAVKVFIHLNMDKKPFRNAVLIYVAVKDKKFSIVGDIAIHEKVGEKYWKKILVEMEHHFSLGLFTDGIKEAIQTVGHTLSKYFPAIDELDKNTLPDDISFE